MACQPLAYSQTTSMFEMPMYFEDTVGNKDTLIIGYDTTASGQNLNPQFGEVLIGTPFDSVFEVRAIHWDDSDLETSKKIIEQYEQSFGIPCGVSGGTKIMINAKYSPVTIRYDSTLFGANSCRGNTILSPDWGIYTLQYWWDAHLFYCLRNTSEITDSLLDNFGGARFLEELEVEGQGIQEVPGFFLVFREWGPCTDSIIGTEVQMEVSSGKISPNPASGWVEVKIPEDLKVVKTSLFDAIGRWAECPVFLQENEVQMDVQSLSSGLYFVVVESESGRRLRYKFLKM